MRFENTEWPSFPYLRNRDDDHNAPEGTGGLEERLPCSPAATGNRGPESRVVPSHVAGRWQSWDLNSGPLNQKGQANQLGKVLPESPCDPGPHFSFLPSALSTQEAWLGPPWPILSAAGWTRGPGVTRRHPGPPPSCLMQDEVSPAWNRRAAPAD